MASTLASKPGPPKPLRISTGPFLLARLAPGAYKIDASLGGRTLHREVQVQANHPASVLFLWPPSPGGADL
jgi:hypothetical protein